MSNIYNDNTYLRLNPTWHVEDSFWKAVQVHKILSKNQITAKTIAEVGCGAGEILKQLSLMCPEKNYLGYEISPQAYSLCASRESSNCKFIMGDILKTNNFFDVCLCMDVIEHVEDYIGFLSSLKKKATYKVFHVPIDINVCAILVNNMIKNRKKYGHIHYFTPETALASIEDVGYKVIDYQFTAFFKELPTKSLRSKIAKYPRLFLYSISPRIMVRLIGGCSLLVLAK